MLSQPSTAEGSPTHESLSISLQIAQALAGITISVSVVSIDTDRLFPPRLQAEIAELVPQSRLTLISSPFGHDGFLVEVEAVGEAIRGTLGSL